MDCAVVPARGSVCKAFSIMAVTIGKSPMRDMSLLAAEMAEPQATPGPIKGRHIFCLHTFDRCCRIGKYCFRKTRMIEIQRPYSVLARSQKQAFGPLTDFSGSLQILILQQFPPAARQKRGRIERIRRMSRSIVCGAAGWPAKLPPYFSAQTAVLLPPAQDHRRWQRHWSHQRLRFPLLNLRPSV